MNKHNLPTTTSTWFLTMTSRKTCSFCLVGDCSRGISKLDLLCKWVCSPYSYYTILSLLTVKESVNITHTSYTWGTTKVCFFEVRYTAYRHQTVHLKCFFFYPSLKTILGTYSYRNVQNKGLDPRTHPTAAGFIVCTHSLLPNSTKR